MTITEQSLRDYLNCKRKLFLRKKCDTTDDNDYSLFFAESKKRFDLQVASFLIEGSKIEIPQSTIPNNQYIWLGFPLLLNVVIKRKGFSVRIDAIRRVAGHSALGDYFYSPILFHPGETVRTNERLLLALMGLTLNFPQHYLPPKGIIILGDSLRRSSVELESLYTRAQELLDEAVNIVQGELEPPLVLNEHCVVCLYRHFCRDQAIDEDNLSLLDRIGERDIQRYNSKGIFTLHQLSFTFRPRRKSKRAKKTASPHNRALQALALREMRSCVLERPGLPAAARRIYVDIEGDERGHSVYLIGILFEEEGIWKYKALWADNKDDEDKIFAELVEFLGLLFPVHLFHFGSYEERVLSRISKLPCCLAPRDAIPFQRDNRTNALTKIFGNVYFPTYSNRLKEIGRYLGSSWTDENASGRYSIMWRKQWEESTDVSSRGALKNKITQYNKEDCFALKSVVEFLYLIDVHGISGVNSEDCKDPIFVESISDGGRIPQFGKKEFASEDFEVITKCAYFDYQQYKVFCRDDAKKRTRTKRLQRKAKTPRYRVNRVMEYWARKCTYCGSTDIDRDRQQYFCKLTLDLRVTSSSIKRWITKCRHARHKCRACERIFVPTNFKRQPRLGHSLMAWVIHNHVANRATFEQMEATLTDHFGLHVRFTKLHDLKSVAARYYSKTYHQIAKRLVHGKLLHADETKIRLQKEDAYVWVFASPEDVFYLCRPTRKADFLDEFLSDFRGVLVTDFYSGYDSVKCLQQKCLIHFLRDVNDALMKHPFDDDVKQFGHKFAELLRQIVEGIDRFGLQKKFLARYKKKADNWLLEIKAMRFTNEAVEKLRKRAVKYESRLFEFLNHDSVPWNNNYAEHAVKPFAKYRRLVNGRVTGRGISNYLVLLSISETCRYSGISFWEFLLSGSRDISRF